MNYMKKLIPRGIGIHKPIFEKAKSLNIIPFSSPFDSSSVDFLENLGVELYKIASFENTDIPLIKKIA